MKYWIRFILHDERELRLLANNARERDFLINKALKKSDMLSKVEYHKINKDGTLPETKVVKG